MLRWLWCTELSLEEEVEMVVIKEVLVIEEAPLYGRSDCVQRGTYDERVV